MTELPAGQSDEGIAPAVGGAGVRAAGSDLVGRAGEPAPRRSASGAVTRPYPLVEKSARISDCDTFRYVLTRHWAPGDALLFVMLNPSTADATLDDPTIRRCAGFARREGFSGVTVLNLYAYRATDPKALLTCTDAVGPQNDLYLGMTLAEQARRGNPVVAAWGANARLDRVGQVLNLVPGVDWRCLGTTKQGAPRHPLYVKGDQPLVPYPWAALSVENDPSLHDDEAR